MKNVLLLVLLGITRVGCAQHLTMSRLLILQKQEFNSTNSFFIDAKWDVSSTSSKKDQSGYIATWQKKSSTGEGICRIIFNPTEEKDKDAGSINTSLNKLTYVTSSKVDYDQIIRQIKVLNYKSDKPVFEEKLALSNYTDGNTVVLVGSANGVYIIKVMSYIVYAYDYTNLIK